MKFHSLAPTVRGVLRIWLVAATLISQSASAATEPKFNSNHWAGATITYLNNATANNGTDEMETRPEQSGEESQPQQLSQVAQANENAMQSHSRLTIAAQIPAASAQTDKAKQNTNNVPLSPLFVCKDGVAADFIAEIAKDAGQLPMAWQHVLAKAGYRVVISRTLFESVPAARGQQVRGYKSSARWSQVYGMFDRRRRQVVMAQLARQTASETSPLIALTDQQTRAGILRHEVGHAIDDSLQYPSHGRSFNQAYAAGLTRLNQHDQDVLKYYLQRGVAGKEEMFAELFATKDGIACDPIADHLLKQKFPEAMAVVNHTISNTPGA